MATLFACGILPTPTDTAVASTPLRSETESTLRVSKPGSALNILCCARMNSSAPTSSVMLIATCALTRKPCLRLRPVPDAASPAFIEPIRSTRSDSPAGERPATAAHASAAKHKYPRTRRSGCI